MTILTVIGFCDNTYRPGLGASSTDWAQLNRPITWGRKKSSAFVILFKIKKKLDD
jgi:hypothetical protein